MEVERQSRSCAERELLKHNMHLVTAPGCLVPRKNVIRAREEMGMTREQVTGLVETDVSVITAIEEDSAYDPQLEIARAVCSVLRMKLDEI